MKIQEIKYNKNNILQNTDMDKLLPARQKFFRNISTLFDNDFEAVSKYHRKLIVLWSKFDIVR